MPEEGFCHRGPVGHSPELFHFMVTLPRRHWRGQHTVPFVGAESTKCHFRELLDTSIVKVQIFPRQSSQGDILDNLALQILQR